MEQEDLKKLRNNLKAKLQLEIHYNKAKIKSISKEKLDLFKNIPNNDIKKISEKESIKPINDYSFLFNDNYLDGPIQNMVKSTFVTKTVSKMDLQKIEDTLTLLISLEASNRVQNQEDKKFRAWYKRPASLLGGVATIAIFVITGFYLTSNKINGTTFQAKTAYIYPSSISSECDGTKKTCTIYGTLVGTSFTYPDGINCDTTKSNCTITGTKK